MEILPDLTIPLPIFYAVVTVYVAYVCMKFLMKKRCERYYEDSGYKQRAVKFDSTNDRSGIACSSPNCVRCNTYRKLLNYARHRIEEFPSSDDIQRVKEAVTNPVTSMSSMTSSLQIAKHNFEQSPNVLYVEGLQALPFWSHFESLHSDIQLLEDNFEIILDEFERCLSIPETDSLWTYNSTPAGAWDVLHLYNQGQRIDAACKSFPKTSEIVQGLPNFMRDCAFGNATFSVIHSNTLIAEHYGPCNVRIRCHLGLQVPENKQYQRCCLTVGNKTRKWQTGRCLVFDDSFLHKAEYVSKDANAEPRIVLMVDFWHPDLTSRERTVLMDLFSVSSIQIN